MNLVLDWFNGVSRGWWEYVVHSSWQAAVVGGLVLGLVQCWGRRWPAPLRYALLVLALLKFACPPLLPVPTGLFSQFASNKVLPATIERKPLLAPGSRAPERFSALGTGGPVFAIISSVRAVSWTTWLMAVHGLGTAAVVFFILRQARRLRWVSRASPAKLGEPLGVQYRDLAIQLGVYQIPPLAISDEVPAPMAFGLKRSLIMLPSRIVGRLSPAELRAVLAHELAHCQRGDLWLNWVQLILLAVWWFHPIAWLVHRCLQDVREDCCDDLILARGVVSNDAYCDVLLHTAAELCPDRSPHAALGFVDRLHPLARRLVRITDWTVQRCERVSRAGASAVLILAALLLPGLRPNETAAASGASFPSSIQAVAVATKGNSAVKIDRERVSASSAPEGGQLPSDVRPQLGLPLVRSVLGTRRGQPSVGASGLKSVRREANVTRSRLRSVSGASAANPRPSVAQPGGSIASKVALVAANGIRSVPLPSPRPAATPRSATVLRLGPSPPPSLSDPHAFSLGAWAWAHGGVRMVAWRSYLPPRWPVWRARS